MTGEKVKAVAAEMVELVHRKSAEMQKSMGLRKIQSLWADRCYDDFVHDMNPGRRRPILLLKHLLYMAEEVPKFVNAGKMDKAMRWLGFMRGVLWALGAATLEELKRMKVVDEAVFTSNDVNEVISVKDAVALATSELRRLLGVEPVGLLIEEVNAGDGGLWHITLSTLGEGGVRSYRAFTVFARDRVAATLPDLGGVSEGKEGG